LLFWDGGLCRVLVLAWEWFYPKGHYLSAVTVADFQP
jgi:hypothetical protein